MKKMSFFRLCFAITAFLILLPANVPAQELPRENGDADRQASEMAIRANVEQFAKAYNAHDAKAVANLFLIQAQIVDEFDNTIQGREDIESLFANVFAEEPETGIKVNVESIRFIGKSLAVELGSTTTVPPAGRTPEVGRYSVLHILKDGKWSMGVVRDVPAEPTHRDHLETIAWLVGDWIDESPDGKVLTSCRWSENRNFLLQDITVRQSGQDVMKVNQRIGWDPLRKQFKAWMFDSEGGYGESNWTPTETGWLIKVSSVNADGTIASATNHIEVTGPDRYVFESVDRVSRNEVMSPVRVVVVRQPPQPQKSLPSAAEK